MNSNNLSINNIAVSNIYFRLEKELIKALVVIKDKLINENKKNN